MNGVDVGGMGTDEKERRQNSVDVVEEDEKNVATDDGQESPAVTRDVAARE